ncbi:restriction endonuclease subunit S [Alginatibacterium sediminis]|uniref:Restriction endonuclease subunit S n=1 Tax=Alginatibacterium sediminis TaxID=2164068 RepID=A0A420E731_9ALTE|nr:restriction endonuclease subunit S [Alginatibacterium sediminis]RKF14351.1 restriction endonuclease subunit S [Alginatibacterium sediminis]
MTEQMNVPKLRFGDFSEQPKTLKLIELSEDGISNGVFNDPKKVGSGYRLINVKDMYETDYVDTGKLTLLDIGAKEFGKNMVRYGDIFFTRSSIVPSGIAYSNVCLSRSNDITYDGHLMKLSPALSRVDPTYLSYKLRTWPMRTRLIRRGKQSTMTTIGQADIADIPVEMPTLPEQQKIASFLSKVDEKIGLLSGKKDKLTEYKRGVMQQLFNGKWHEQDGQLTFTPPTLRFKADDGNEFPDWEEKKLGEVFSISAGGDVDKKHSNKVRTDKFRYPVFANAETNKGLYGYSDVYKVDQPCITVSGRGSLGNALYRNEAFYPIVRLLVLKPQFALNLKFFEQTINKLNIYNESTGVPQLTAPQLKTYSVLFPSTNEQNKIASFLTLLEQKIDLVNSELETAKEWKKGLLQQMFL